METATGGYLYGKKDPSAGIIEERAKAGKPQNSGCIPRPRGRPRRSWSVKRRSIRKTTGIRDLHPHMFGHSHATRLHELGVDDKSIQHWEGHASQDTTTKIYIKQTNDRTERAGKILSNFALEADPCAHLVPFLGEDENAENSLYKSTTECVNSMRA